MLNQTDLNMVKKGDPINHYLLLKKCEIKLTKTNKQYLYLELADKTLSLTANVWENFSKIYTEIKTGDVVKVIGSMDDYQGVPQIKINSIKTADPADKLSPADFLARSKRNVEEMKNELITRIQKNQEFKIKNANGSVF